MPDRARHDDKKPKPKKAVFVFIYILKQPEVVNPSCPINPDL
jgi:hypothetical protein